MLGVLSYIVTKIKSKQETTFSKQKNKGLALPIPLSVSFIVQYDSI